MYLIIAIFYYNSKQKYIAYMRQITIFKELSWHLELYPLLYF